jgi:hypothetical protein
MTHGIAELDRPGQAGERRFLYGLIAEYSEASEILAASRQAHRLGYRRMDAYTPFPVEDLPESLGFRDHLVPWIMFWMGLLGCAVGFLFMRWTQVSDYLLNIGGKPAESWPMWIPITFECTVLGAALSGVFGMLIVNKLPQPYHPVFDAPNFAEASSSRFFLCIESRDPKFDPVETRRFLESTHAARVSEVELRK